MDACAIMHQFGPAIFIFAGAGIISYTLKGFTERVYVDWLRAVRAGCAGPWITILPMAFHFETLWLRQGSKG